MQTIDGCFTPLNLCTSSKNSTSWATLIIYKVSCLYCNILSANVSSLTIDSPSLIEASTTLVEGNISNLLGGLFIIASPFISVEPSSLSILTLPIYTLRPATVAVE